MTKLVHCCGVTYASLREFASKNGLKYSTACHRFAKGLVDKDLLQGCSEIQHRVKRSGFIIEYLGKTYRSLSEFTREFDLDYNGIYYYFSRGYSVEEIFNGRISWNKGGAQAVSCMGVTYRSVREFALKNNLAPSSVHWRLRNGWTFEDILNNSASVDDSTKNKNIRFQYYGKTYHSLKEFARSFGLDYKNVYLRYKQGWSLEDIALNAEKARCLD